MKIIDKMKSEKISSLMCVTTCRTQACFAKEYTLTSGIVYFSIIMPFLTYLLLKLIAQRKKKQVSFMTYFLTLLFSLLLYSLLFFSMSLHFHSFSDKLFELLLNSRKLIFIALLLICVVSFILGVYKKVKWPYFFIPLLTLLAVFCSAFLIDYC